MTIELCNLRRVGLAVLVDARVTIGKVRSVYPLTFRTVGSKVRASMASGAPREVVAEILAAAQAFGEKNHETISGLLFEQEQAAR